MAPHVAGRGVLLDVGRVIGDAGELPDGFAIAEEHLAETAEAHGVAVGRGDIVLVRTGQLARTRREGWGDYAGGPAPGLSGTPRAFGKRDSPPAAPEPSGTAGQVRRHAVNGTAPHGHTPGPRPGRP